ncbi:MAG: peptidoglycan DD-metalloendopeptidase family protein [Bacillota bacterium]
MLRQRKTRRAAIKCDTSRVYTLMLVSAYDKTLTLRISLRAIIALMCTTLAVVLMLSVFSIGYVLARRRISEYRHLEAFEDNVRSQVASLQEEYSALYSRLQDAWLEVEELRDVLREEGISKQEAGQARGARTPDGLLPVSRGGLSRLASFREISKTVESLREDSDQLRFLAADLEESVSLVSHDVSAEVDLRRATPSIRPVDGAITSQFGWRVHPMTKVNAYHSGVDVAAPAGAVIKAAADGTVTAAGWEGGYGIRVVIAHGFGIETLYGHCSTTLVRPGQEVKRGNPIARVGNTGVSTGPHLHYEVRLEGDAVDPEQYLPE